MKKKILTTLLAVGLMATMLTGCQTEAQRVSYNLSQEADNFNIVRQLTVINCIEGDVLFQMTGRMSITADTADNQLEIIVEDDVWIGSNSMICTGVTIGKCAVIGTNSVVRSSIPPYALAYGNPAKIVSFVMAPKDAFENEKANYSIENRINLQDLKDNYSKYFVDRIKNIKEFIK